MARFFPVWAVFCAAVGHLHAASTPALVRESWNRPVPEWREGPVRYLLTDDESKGYRLLATAGERAAFITRFWASRDPDPYNSANEVEEAFWRRVSAAEELFTQTTISGWRTDRGRVYILLGPPDEISSYPLPSAGELDPTHFQDGLKRGSPSDIRYGQRGAVEWTYRNLPGPAAEAGQMVTFVRDETGEYRLSQRLAPSFRFEPAPGYPRPASRGVRGAASAGASGGLATGKGARDPDDPRTGGASGTLESDLARANRFEDLMRSVENLFAFGQASLFEKAPRPEIPAGRVTSSQFFGVVPVRSRLDFFQGDGGTTTLIILGIPSEETGPAAGASREIQIFGQLERLEDPLHTYRFSSTKSAADGVPRVMIEGREHRLFEVRGVLPPGEYRVSLGARIEERIGTLSDRIEVPDLGGGSLRLAGPALVERVGEALPDAGAPGFTLGRLQLVPKLDPAYAAGSDFGFYFQACNARPDPGDGRLHLDIDYGISERRKGVFRPLGRSVTLRDNAASAHAYTFPLRGWAAGEYLLTVTVADRVSGAVQAGSAAFQVQ